MVGSSVNGTFAVHLIIIVLGLEQLCRLNFHLSQLEIRTIAVCESWIIFLPFIDLPLHTRAVDEVLDGDLFTAVPALLGLVSTPDETVNELVDGTHFADVEATAWRHLRI